MSGTSYSLEDGSTIFALEDGVTHFTLEGGEPTAGGGGTVETLSTTGFVTTTVEDGSHVEITYAEVLTTNIATTTVVSVAFDVLPVVNVEVEPSSVHLIYQEVLASAVPTARVPLHDDARDLDGTNYSFSNPVLSHAPINITNLRGRRGLADSISSTSGVINPTLASQAFAVSLAVEIPRSYRHLDFPIGLYSHGSGTNGVMLLLDDFDLVMVSVTASVDQEVARFGLPGPGTHHIALDVLSGSRLNMYVNGQFAGGSVATLSNGTAQTYLGNAVGRFEGTALPNNSTTAISTYGIRLAEFVLWKGDDRVDITDFAQLMVDVYSSLLVAAERPHQKLSFVPVVTIGTSPPPDIRAAFEANVVRPVRWVDVYDSDNATLLHSKVAIESGTITVDMTRDDRRNIDLVMSDKDGALGYGPDEFWWDKYIWAYRGVEMSDGSQWVSPLGQFMPDTITRPHFPKMISLSGRDLTKKLLKDKIGQTTSFAVGANVGTVISALATNGGVTKQTFASTTQTLTSVVTFEIGTARWEAMKELAASISFELYFNSEGSLVFRPYVDPLLAPVSMTFRDGSESNLSNYSRSTSDARLFNEVLVYGSSTDNASVWARAQNISVTSPTRISKIGRRTHAMPLQFVPNNATAQQIANDFLKVAGLEQYDVNFAGVIYPWLDVGEAIEFIVSDASAIDPTRFLLSSLTIPLGLEAMTSVSRRVTIVG